MVRYTQWHAGTATLAISVIRGNGDV